MNEWIYFSVLALCFALIICTGIVCDYMSKQEDRLLQVTLKEMDIRFSIEERNKGK